MKGKLFLFLAMLLFAACNQSTTTETTATDTAAQSKSVTASGIPVTTDNFTRAETDMYFASFVKRGAFGKFYHFRELPLENTGVRPNRDTYYSEVVADLDAGPVTITLPDAGKRFMSLIVIDEDHYVTGVVYGAGTYTYTKEQVGGFYNAARPEFVGTWMVIAQFQIIFSM